MAWALREWVFFLLTVMFAALWIEAERRAADEAMNADALDVELQEVEAERDRLLVLTRVEVAVRRRVDIVAGPVVDR